jgi:hypothetical protein
LSVSTKLFVHQDVVRIFVSKNINNERVISHIYSMSHL